MQILGYFEGTDALILTRLTAKGIDTLPLSNGFDGHGKYVAHITKDDGISVVVGYLHKVLPTSKQEITPEGVLYACRTHGIPVLIIAPSSDHGAARELLGNTAEFVMLVDPSDLYDKVLEVTG
jgi:hypothetical protein